MMWRRIGIPPISTIGLGRMTVSSARRDPLPPARMATFGGRLPFELPFEFPFAVTMARCPELSFFDDGTRGSLRVRDGEACAAGSFVGEPMLAAGHGPFRGSTAV